MQSLHKQPLADREGSSKCNSNINPLEFLALANFSAKGMSEASTIIGTNTSRVGAQEMLIMSRDVVLHA